MVNSLIFKSQKFRIYKIFEQPFAQFILSREELKKTNVTCDTKKNTKGCFHILTCVPVE